MRQSEILAAGLVGVISLTVLYGLGDALIPLLAAGFMAYLLLPMVRRLERRGVPKQAAVAAAILVAGAIVISLLLVLVPILVSDLKAFAADLPDLAEKALVKVDTLSSRFGITLPFSLEREVLVQEAKSYLLELPVGTLKAVGTYFGKALSGVVGLLLWILNLLLIPIFFFHLVADFDGRAQATRALIPPRYRNWFGKFLNRADEIIAAYFRGQLLVSLILGLLYGIGFWLVGLRFGILIGLLTGFLNVIPFAGVLIGLLLAAVVALANFEGIGSLVGVLGTFALVQGMEGFVITPKIVGDRVGLNALETMLALIVAGNLAGFAGMLVAIPVAGIVKFLWLECRDHFVNSEYYSSGPV